MSQKAPKNGTSSGGDERNMYSRRFKSTSNPSEASSSIASLAEKEGESESSNRLKHSGASVKQSGIAKTNVKSKLRTPVKTGLGQSTNRVNKPNTVSANKEIKKTSIVTKAKGQMTKMKEEIETLERKQKTLNAQTESKESTEQVDNNKQINDANHSNNQPSEQHENRNSNEFNGKETQLEENSNQNGTKENGNAEQNEAEIPEANEKEEEFNLLLEAEENCIKPEENTPRGSSETSKDGTSQNELKTSTEEAKEDSQTDAESYSVDVVESTTSEMSEATESTESTAPLENKDKDNENQDANSDAVSYNSSIMLKDVKIKLNDCLKDSKCTDFMKDFESGYNTRQIPVLNAEEEGNVDQSLPEYAHKEDTFGKTLRTISGRNSLSRMRNITLRDRQPSPNSSLFVNTSNFSFSEDGTSDYKILHYRSTLSELPSSNGGTPIDKKRRLLQESTLSSKKPKKEVTGLLNSSFELLKYPFSPRRPVQVSTPYKYEKEKVNVSTSEVVKTEEKGVVKKWCVIM